MMEILQYIIEFLKRDVILVLFLVIAIGYLIGKIKVKGFHLGVAAVLFVGLAFGAFDPDIRLPDIVYTLGLIFFVYTIGLQSGPSFFASLNRTGISYNLMVIFVLSVTSSLTIFLGLLLEMKAGIISGLFAGSLTNTPALATVIEFIKNKNELQSGADLDILLSEPVIGYSLSYPFGVIGVILSLYVFKKIYKIDYTIENKKLSANFGLSNEDLENATVLVTNAKLFNWSIKEIFKAKEDLSSVIISRIKRNGKVQIVEGETILQAGDILTLVGAKTQLDLAISIFGEKMEESIEIERTHLDYRRIFVSNPEVIGVPFHKLDLHRRFRATITRLKRGDIDIVPTPNTVLEAGDRIRVVASREDLPAVAKFFGDSFFSLSQVDYISTSIGIALGLLLGSLPLPLPGGGDFKLGFAGGPLIIALVLGKIGRTGPMIWTLSYNANLTLRQTGVVLFLAGIGLKAGYAFSGSLSEYGMVLLVLGAIVTFFNTSLALLIGIHILQVPFPLLLGIISGMQTQPAVLAFSNDEAKSNAPNIGYAIVFPVAMIMKIILVSFIYKLLLP
jgi:putative transport protein